MPLPRDRLQDYPILLRTSADPDLVMRGLEPVIAEVDPGLTVTRRRCRRCFAVPMRSSRRAFRRRLPPASACAGCCSRRWASTAPSATTSSFAPAKWASAWRSALRSATFSPRDARKPPRRARWACWREWCSPVGAARLLRGVLYGLGAIDAVSFAGASLLFLTIALAASWLPSRRAMRIDPLVALRDQ